tara:strand:+ start:760 stop:981 length:222 start_codon:yes stop_codon:yes gene_type:complete
MKKHIVLTTHNFNDKSPLKEYELYCKENNMQYDVVDLYDSWDYVTLCWKFPDKKNAIQFETYVRLLGGETYIP